MSITGITYNSQISLNTGNTTPHAITFIPPLSQEWVGNNGDDSIYKYAAGVYHSKIGLPTGNTQPRGFAFVASRGEVFSLDLTGWMYRITPATGASPGRYALHTNNSSGEGILFFAAIDEVWVIDKGDRLIYRYKASDGSYIGTYALSPANNDARGACYVFGEAWILNATDKKVYRYGATGNFIGTFDLSSLHQTPRSMARVGTELWVVDNGNDKIFKYQMTGNLIARVAEQNMTVLTAYRLQVIINGDPDDVTVTGDLEYFDYDWDSTNNRVTISGTPQSIFTGKQWRVTAVWDSPSQTLTRDITYNVNPPAPILLPLPALHIYQGTDVNIDVLVQNKQGNVTAEGLLIGWGKTDIADGIKINGKIPATADADFTVASGQLKVTAANQGGAPVVKNYPFTIESGTPGALGAADWKPSGNYGKLSFSDITHALGYEWTTETGAADAVQWNFFSSTRSVIDPGGIKVTPGHLQATVTFPVVTGATVYEYALDSDSHKVDWTLVVGTVSNSMITTIIPDLEDGTAYTLRLRVASPWVGPPISITVYGGRLSYVIHSDNNSQRNDDMLYIFHTGVPDGGTAVRIKRLQFPTTILQPEGVAVDNSGNVYILNTIYGTGKEKALYVFSASAIDALADGARMTQSRKNLLPSSLNNTFSTQGIGVYDDELYMFLRNAGSNSGMNVARSDVADGQALTILRNTILRENKYFTPSFSADRDVVYKVADTGVSQAYLQAYDNNSGLSTTPYSSSLRLVSRTGGNIIYTNITGLKVIGNTPYTVERVNDTMARYKFDVDANRYVIDWSINLPVGLTRPRCMDIR